MKVKLKSLLPFPNPKRALQFWNPRKAVEIHGQMPEFDIKIREIGIIGVIVRSCNCHIHTQVADAIIDQGTGPGLRYEIGSV